MGDELRQLWEVPAQQLGYHSLCLLLGTEGCLGLQSICQGAMSGLGCLAGAGEQMELSGRFPHLGSLSCCMGMGCSQVESLPWASFVGLVLSPRGPAATQGAALCLDSFRASG